MSDKRDFDYGICKIPRKDKDGNDISNDRIGRGGRHRSNGTYSGPVYDVEVVDGDPSLPKTKIVYRDRPIYYDRLVIINKEPPVWKMVTADLIREFAPVLIDGVETAIRSWWTDRKERNAKRLSKNEARREIPRSRASVHRLKAEQVLQEAHSRGKNYVAESESSSVSAKDEFDSAYEQYTINLTSEEAKKELIDIFILTIMREKKIQKLRHARIEDAADHIIDGVELVKRLEDPAVLNSINNILEHKPELLDDMQETYLTSLLGRELIVDSIFIPIKRSEISRIFAVA